MSSAYVKIPESEIRNRITNLKLQLNQDNFDGALLLSYPELYYYSGIGLPGAVYIPAEGDSIRLVKRNPELAKSYSPLSIQGFGRLAKLFDTLEIKAPARIAIEADVVPFSLVVFLKSKAKDCQLDDGSLIFRQLRAVKSPYEIGVIEQAAILVDQAFEHVTEIAIPEMTEIELAARLDGWMAENGHAGFIPTRQFGSVMIGNSYVIGSASATLNSDFTPISGRGLSLKEPLGPTREKLGKEPFFIDTCGNCQGYISDTTRTFIIGQFDDETRNQIEALQQIKQFITTRLKPGENLGIIYHEVFDLAKELKILNQFMGTDADRVAFLGHGVGLEIDELPIFYAKGPDLVPGNVFASEPKLFVQDRKVLGIEDTYAITESGNTLLSKAPDYFEI
ncbi:MAG: M24 family metallopeptidase [Promethearchaeota archaeon]